MNLNKFNYIQMEVFSKYKIIHGIVYISFVFVNKLRIKCNKMITYLYE